MPVPNTAHLPMRNFVVTYLLPTFPEPMVDKTEFSAAYFVEEGTLVSFKDSMHAVVESFKSELVVHISRTGEVVDNAR